MPAPRDKVRELITGDYRALEAEFLSCLRDLREADALSPVLVIVTSRLLGLHLKRYLAENGLPHLNIRFFTLEDLARQIAEPVICRKGKTRMPGIASTQVMAETLRSVTYNIDDFYFSAITDRPGFHDAMLATIRDLEEATLTPDDLRRAVRKPGVKKAVHLKKIEDLTAVWEAYRDLLDGIGWVDDYQVMLEAAAHLVDAPLVRDAASFVVYGFYDFNSLQRKLLERCIEAKDTVALMPFQDSRAFDFARPTLRWLESNGFLTRPAAAPGETGESPVLLQLRGHLFADSAESSLSQDAVKFISAPGEVREVKEIARAIAAEAGEHDFRSHQVGILLRDAKTYGPVIREKFGVLGIEPYVPEGRPLSETVEGKSVLLLLEVLAHNYARSKVMEFVTFAPLRSQHGHGKTGPAPPVHRWDAASVAAGIIEERSEWDDRLARLAAELLSAPDPESYGERWRRDSSFVAADIESLRRFIGKMASLLDDLAKAKTWNAKATALTKALKDLTEPGKHTDQVAEAIEGLKDLDRIPTSPNQAEFMEAVTDCLESSVIRLGRFERRGPAVMSLTGARGVPFEMAIVPGMTERGFPPVIRQDAILLDHEREVLNQALEGGGQLHLISRRRLDEERMLFRLAVGAARRSLVLTFPRLVIGTSKERLPSSFILAAAEALTGHRTYFDTIESTEGFRRVPLAEIAVSEPGDAVDQVEFDLAISLKNIRSETPGGLLCLRRFSPFFAEGLRMESARWGKHRFTIYDAVLAGSQALELLKRDHDILDSKVSPTRLEAYSACPFRYLMEHILEIEPLVEPEEARTISPLDKGALVHRILWKFFTALKEKRGDRLGVSPGDRALLRKFARQAFRHFEKNGVIGYPVMWELEKETMLAWLESVLEEETGQDEFHPAYFEVRYGMRRWTSEESEISTDQAVPLKFGDRRIFLRGKIDRIDLSEDGRRAKVIDYKTGKPRAKEDDFQGGTTLQLPLYIHAARRVLDPLHPEVGEVSAEYYHLTAKGKGRHIGFSGDRLEEKRGELTEILNTVADGIAGGLFFPLPGDLCRWCGFALACGPQRHRMLERKLGDPRAKAFLRMRGEIEPEPGEGETD